MKLKSLFKKSKVDRGKWDQILHRNELSPLQKETTSELLAILVNYVVSNT